MEFDNFETQIIIDLIGAVNHPLSCRPTTQIGLANSNIQKFRDFNQNPQIFLGFQPNPDVILRMEIERSMSLLQVLVYTNIYFLCEYLVLFLFFSFWGNYEVENRILTNKVKVHVVELVRFYCLGLFFSFF